MVIGTASCVSGGRTSDAQRCVLIDVERRTLGFMTASLWATGKTIYGPLMSCS